MKSKRAFEYDRRPLGVGEVFDADPRLVRTLTAVGFAEVVEESEEYRTASIDNSPRRKRLKAA